MQQEQLRKHKGQNLCDVLCFPALQTYGTLNSTLYTVHCTCWFGFVSGQGKGDKYEDKSINLFQYFTSSCYTGFGDDDKVGYTYSQSTKKTIEQIQSELFWQL